MPWSGCSLIEFDIWGFNLINQHMVSPVLDVLLPSASWLGDSALIWLVSGGLLFLFGGKEGKKAAVLGLFALLISHLAVDHLFKDLVARPRPFWELPQARVLVTPPASFSFPSGHSAQGLAIATVWFGLGSRMGVPALVVAFLIAFSRIYVGVHYPLDVLGGMLVGVLTAAGTLAAGRFWRRV